MSMTKKDYELIADEFKQQLDNIAITDNEYDKGRYDTWYILVMNFSNTLADDNPQFDRERFLQACGVMQ